MNKYLLIVTFLILCFNPLNVKAKEITEDNIVNSFLQNTDIKKPYIHKNYDYHSTKSIPLRISIKDRIKSESDLYEGQIVEFVVQKSIYEGDKIKIKRGDIIEARVSTIITSGMNGIPASVIFDYFKVKNAPDKIKPGQISDALEIFGQDRSYFVFPLKWALTFLPPTGSLTNFIKGGHVRIKPKKVFTVYYYPEWL